MAKLFKPPPVPQPPDGFLGNPALGVKRPNQDNRKHDPTAELLEHPDSRNIGQFHARIYDGQTIWAPNVGSKRWRLKWPRDIMTNRDDLSATPSKEYGYWADMPDTADYRGAGRDYACRQISAALGGYRELQAQFLQMAGMNQDHKIPWPAKLRTEQSSPLGPVYYSSVNTAIPLSGDGRGFFRGPPQSHYMDKIEGSPTFGQWIEPDRKWSIENDTTKNFNYWYNAISMRAFLKPGVSHLHLWCPDGTYREFDTSDKEHFKVTKYNDFNSEEVSLPIRAGHEIGTIWDLYLIPQTVQMLAEWWDYYDVFTPFTYFIWGFHNIFNYIGRLPSFPVVYGETGGQLDDIMFVSDWVYNVAQWHGAFDPPLLNAHPIPVPGTGIWEGPPLHGTDWSVEFMIKIGILVKHNPHWLDTVVGSFFGILYSWSSPVSYFVRLAFQPPGPAGLCAVLHDKGRNWYDAGTTYYIWVKKPPDEAKPPDAEHPEGTPGLVRRTLNWGSMFYDWDAVEGDFWTMKTGLQLGGWI